jgi:hypothetical protein
MRSRDCSLDNPERRWRCSKSGSRYDRRASTFVGGHDEGECRSSGYKRHSLRTESGFLTRPHTTASESLTDVAKDVTEPTIRRPSLAAALLEWLLVATFSQILCWGTGCTSRRCHKYAQHHFFTIPSSLVTSPCTHQVPTASYQLSAQLQPNHSALAICRPASLQGLQALAASRASPIGR